MKFLLSFLSFLLVFSSVPLISSAHFNSEELVKPVELVAQDDLYFEYEIEVDGVMIKDEEVHIAPEIEPQNYLNWVAGSRVLPNSFNVKYRENTYAHIAGQVNYGSRTATIDGYRPDSVELFVYFRGHVDKMRSAEMKVATLGIATLLKEVSAVARNGGSITVATVGRLAKAIGFSLASGTIYSVYLFGHHYQVATRQADILIRNN